MKKDSIREKLKFKPLTEEEKNKRHILGRLYGPVADIINPTRNGRYYSEDVWKEVFKNPVFQENIKNLTIYGELGHPEDRDYIDMEKAAICLPEVPKEDEDGHLVAYFDILDTPNGRILKTLCEYGSILGISSRGTGDIVEDINGNESVDPSTYNFTCFDVVLTPAVESARLKFEEGLENNNGKSLKRALLEDLNSASYEDQKIMKETLQNLKLDVSPENKQDLHIEESKDKVNNQVAIDDGMKKLTLSLQEALKSNSNLKLKIKSLQEELAVSNTKVDDIQSKLLAQENQNDRLDAMITKNKKLAEQVESLKVQLTETQNQLKEFVNNKEKLVRSNKDVLDKNKSLSESLTLNEGRVKALQEKLNDKNTTITKLTEELKEEKRTLTEKINSLNTSLTKSTKLCEAYKTLSNKTIDKYISFRATMLGVNPNEIKNKLDESYTLNDVDRACEELQNNQLNINRLPILTRGSRIKITESKQPSLEDLDKNNFDEDEVDVELLNLAKIKK